MKTIIKSILIGIGVLFFSCTLFAQQPKFSKVYYDIQSSVRSNAIINAADSSYLICGERNGDGLIMKLNSAGDTVWVKSIGYGASAELSCLTSTRDSCYVLAGSFWNQESEKEEILLLKMNDQGDTLWSRSINSGENVTINSLQQTHDKGFILAGVLNTDTQLNSLVLVSKLDEEGNVVWLKSYYAYNNTNEAFSVKEFGDNQFIVSGGISNFNPFYQGAFLMKLDGNGDILWARRYSEIENLSGSDLLIGSSEIYLCLQGYNWYTYLAKLDPEGQLQWVRRYPGAGWSLIWGNHLRIHPTSDHHLVFTSPGQFGRLMKVDLEGHLDWSSDLFLDAVDVVENPQHGFLVIGNGPIFGVKSHVNSNPHIGVILTDSTGNGADCIYPNPQVYESVQLDTLSLSFTSQGDYTTGRPNLSFTDDWVSIKEGCVDFIGGTKELDQAEESISIFPNPADQMITVHLSAIDPSPNDQVYIIDNQGRQMDKFPATVTTVDISTLRDGLYTMMLVTHSGILSHKLIIIHR